MVNITGEKCIHAIYTGLPQQEVQGQFKINGNGWRRVLSILTAATTTTTTQTTTTTTTTIRTTMKWKNNNKRTVMGWDTDTFHLIT